jgi:hypothetical protein
MDRKLYCILCSERQITSEIISFLSAMRCSLNTTALSKYNIAHYVTEECYTSNRRGGAGSRKDAALFYAC